MHFATPPAFFAPGESLAAGRAVARAAGLEPAPLEERTFDDGEFKLRPLESVRGRTVFVYQSLAGSAEAPAAQRLVRLLFLLANLRDNGARRCIAVVPYLAYARKDRRTQPRDPVHTRYVAELLEAAGAQRLVALDVHNTPSLDNAYRIPVDHLSALPMLADHFARRIDAEDLAVASPDIGGVKRVQIFQQLLGRRLGREVDLVFVEKRRARGAVSGGTVVGLHRRGMSVILLDDLCATGGTLVRAAEACMAAGASAVHAAVTHAPSRRGIENVLAGEAIASLTVTDSVDGSLREAAAWHPGRIECVSVAPLLGEALARLRDGRPLVALLDRWPLAPDA